MNDKNSNVMGFKTTLEGMKELEKKIDNIISSDNNKIFIKILLFYFEILYENFYFQKIKEQKDVEEEKYKQILNEENKVIIINYLNYLNNNETINLQFIYRIAFIKIYFMHFVDIMYKYNNGNEIISFDDLIKDFSLDSRKLGMDIKALIFHYLEIKCQADNKDLNDFISKAQIEYLSDNVELKQRNNYISEVINKCIPNKHLLKIEFNSKENKNKYPLLNQYVNNELHINFLKKLKIINEICNSMLDLYSYNKTLEEIKEEKLKDKDYYLYKLNKNLIGKLPEYIKEYNYLLDIEKLKDFNISDNEENLIKNFLIFEKDENNKLNYIYKKFIQYQNNFISNISEKYFKNKNIEEIKIYEACENNIIKFSALDSLFLDILLNNTLIIFDNDNNIKGFEFWFEEIENDLAEKNLPGLKKFIEGEIRTMKYKGDSCDMSDDDIGNDFNRKYNKKDLNENQKQKVMTFLNDNSNNSNNILQSIKYLMRYFLSHPDYKSEDYIQFDEKISNDSKEENKDNLGPIKSLFDENDDDDFSQMNGTPENKTTEGFEGFTIGNLYSIYLEIKKYKFSN